MVEPNTKNKKNDYISDLINSRPKMIILSTFFNSSRLLDLIFQVFMVAVLSLILIFLTQDEKKIDYLINMIQSLALSIYTL